MKVISLFPSRVKNTGTTQQGVEEVLFSPCNATVRSATVGYVRVRSRGLLIDVGPPSAVPRVTQRFRRHPHIRTHCLLLLPLLNMNQIPGVCTYAFLCNYQYVCARRMLVAHVLRRSFFRNVCLFHRPGCYTRAKSKHRSLRTFIPGNLNFIS